MSYYIIHVHKQRYKLEPSHRLHVWSDRIQHNVDNQQMAWQAGQGMVGVRCLVQLNMMLVYTWNIIKEYIFQ